jgi:hypothetical protein
MTTQEDILDIQSRRGAVGTNFASIEFFVAQFVTIHYFGALNPDFTAEVFEDEYFSFGLLVKIFDKVLKKYSEEYKKFPFQKLRRLQKLRNIIVHARLQSYAKIGPDGENIQDIGETYFHHAGEDYDRGPLTGRGRYHSSPGRDLE